MARKSTSKSATRSASKRRVSKKSSSTSTRSSSSASTMSTMTAGQLSKVFGLWFVGHSLVVYFANQFFPEMVALGNHAVSPLWAIIYSMLVFTLIAVGAMPVIEYIAQVQRRKLSGMDWMVAYFVINAVGLWIVARFAEQVGLGLSSWLVAIALALVFDVMQGVLVMKVSK